MKGGENILTQEHAAIMWNIYPDPTHSYLVTPLVKDPTRANPLWKLPGGRSEGAESGRRTAIRENLEEVGIWVPEDELKNPKWELEYPREFADGKKRYQNHRKDHDFFAYFYIFSENQETKEQGKEGESVKIFPLNHLVNPHHPVQEGLLRSHAKIIQQNFGVKIFDELNKRLPTEFLTACVS